MPEPVVALVSAEDFVSAVRVHSDRVHDLVRRTGCSPAEAVEIVEGSALDLLEMVVDRADEVGDLVGWWFGHAHDLARRVVSRNPDRTMVSDEAATGSSVLAGTQGEAQVRAALATLSDRYRTAVLLRDAYDLPPASVAVAMAASEAAAVAMVAEGRLKFLAEYDQRPVPVPTEHAGRSVDVSDLARLADGSLRPQQAVALRRHVYGCTSCEELLEAMSKARRVVAGLPVLALPDEDRDELLARMTDRAQAVLPTLEELLLVSEDLGEPAPVVSPAAATAVLVGALLLGVLVGYLTRGGPTKAAALGLSPTPTLTASVTASPTPARSHSPTPTPSPTLSPTPSPSPTPRVSTTTPAPGPATLTVSPAGGPNGQTLTVTGTGWQPGLTVTLTYLNPVGSPTGSNATAIPNSAGRFVTSIVAQDPANLPGPHRVHATNGTQTADATYQSTF